MLSFDVKGVLFAWRWHTPTHSPTHTQHTPTHPHTHTHTHQHTHTPTHPTHPHTHTPTHQHTNTNIHTDTNTHTHRHTTLLVVMSVGHGSPHVSILGLWTENIDTPPLTNAVHFHIPFCTLQPSLGSAPAHGPRKRVVQVKVLDKDKVIKARMLEMDFFKKMGVFSEGRSRRGKKRIKERS